MFGVVRLVVGCIFFLIFFTVIRKSKLSHKRIIYTALAVLSAALIVVLSLLPFENLFVTFNSPKTAYKYYNFGKSKVELVVDGSNSDLVVARNNDSDAYLIIPKTESGWKLGIGSDSKRIVQKHFNGIVVCVYQYKNTNDYFITVLDTNGGKSTVSDSYNTEFCFLEKDNDALGKTFVTYYAHITEFNSKYNLTVNGNKITLE